MNYKEGVGGCSRWQRIRTDIGILLLGSCKTRTVVEISREK